MGPVTLNSDFQLYISVNHAVTIDEAKDFFSEMEKVLTSIKKPVSSGRNRYQPGNIVGGKYEILDHLEQGLCYDVFISMDIQTKQKWIARAIYKDGEPGCASWVQAVTLNKKLDHPLLARIVDVLDEEDHILVVMKYVEGTPLSTAIQERAPIPEEQIRDWGIQIADLLNYLHRQDPAFSQILIWPSQFLLTPSGDIKMRYFTGIQEENALLIKSRPSVFIAPEESSQGKADPRTDIYAFGYLLYSILTGRDFSKPPYAVLPLRSARPDLSGAMEHIVRKCIEPNPRDRYQSAGELLKDLKNMDKRKPSSPSFFQRLLHSFERKQP